jgi:hypothetical protein
MMKYKCSLHQTLVVIFCLIIITIFPISAIAQVEHIPIVHPVYTYLLRAETKGLLPHFSLSSLPLQRQEIRKALNLIDQQKDELTDNEKAVLLRFQREFILENRENAVLVQSESDSTNLLFSSLFSDKEKLVYMYKDSTATVQIHPLAMTGIFIDKQHTENAQSVTYAQGGARIMGTLSNALGFFLQVTNGTVVSGEREVALRDPRLKQNIKFATFNSDFDFTESHLRFDHKWFYAYIGRENRVIGSGYFNRIFLSDAAPPSDAIMLGAKFKTVEYRFMHASLLSVPEDSNGRLLISKNDIYPAGPFLNLRPKYFATHRISWRPSWGEISLWDGIIYSRPMDIGYLNPLSFYKSVEHSLRDRDNSMMGFDMTIRPVSNIQLKGSFLLDDIIFKELGSDFWSNKTTFNIGAAYATPYNCDIQVEYARVFPFTFSHFNPQNSATNDVILMMGSLPPNSDEISTKFIMWWGNRYPLQITAAYIRHGENIVDANNNVIVNAGGDIFLSNTGSQNAPFLNGNLRSTFLLQLDAGWEIIRGFNVQSMARLQNINGEPTVTARILFRMDDF